MQSVKSLNGHRWVSVDQSSVGPHSSAVYDYGVIMQVFTLSWASYSLHQRKEARQRLDDASQNRTRRRPRLLRVRTPSPSKDLKLLGHGFHPPFSTRCGLSTIWLSPLYQMFSSGWKMSTASAIPTVRVIGLTASMLDNEVALSRPSWPSSLNTHSLRYIEVGRNQIGSKYLWVQRFALCTTGQFDGTCGGEIYESQSKIPITISLCSIDSRPRTCTAVC